MEREPDTNTGVQLVGFVLGVIALTLLFVLALWFYTPDRVHAEDALVFSTGGLGYSAYFKNGDFYSLQQLGSGWSDTVNKIVGVTNNGGGTATYIQTQILCFTDVSYTIPCTNSALSDVVLADDPTPLGSGTKYATTTLPTAYTMTTSNFYKIKFLITSSANNRYIYGNPTFAGGASEMGTASSCSSGCPNDLYFELWRTVLPASSLIQSLDPTNGTTTASATFQVNIGYYAASGAGWDTVGYTIYNIDRNYQQEAASSTTAVQGTPSTFTDTITLRENGAYSLQAYLHNSSSGSTLYSGSSATGANSQGNSYFSVVSNPLPGLIGTTSVEAIYSLATSTCSITNLTGCFQNALVWAFYPSESMMSQLANAGSAVKNKPPFGYIFVNVETLQALNASGTAPVALASVLPITDTIFHPLDIGLAALFGFFFAVWFFMRVRHIEL